MNRLIAVNSVPLSGADLPPGTGTPQYATDGSPVGPIPPTIWPAYAWNMAQDEIINVIVSAGLTPDSNDWTQLLQAINAKITAGTVTPGFSLANPGYQKFAGGFIRQFGNLSVAANTILTVTYATPFLAGALNCNTVNGGTSTSVGSFPPNMNIRNSGADLTKMQIANPNGITVAFDWEVWGV